MNSFKLAAVANLARNPEPSTKGEATFARFCLVGDDQVAGAEKGPLRDVVTSLWFIAFGGIATAIAQRARKGVELKVGEFKAAYKAQMELYLRWLDKHEREPEEASPLGIILCTGKKSEQIELLELDKSGIHVAEYLTTLPPRAVLVERLHQATQRAQLQIARRSADSSE
jgi:YhcG PDDEXK nuclease domain